MFVTAGGAGDGVGDADADADADAAGAGAPPSPKMELTDSAFLRAAAARAAAPGDVSKSSHSPPAATYAR